MADKRGGHQRPKDPAAVSGIGKNSKRTDGKQAIKSPNVQDSTDLQTGDRERIRQGQRIAPLGASPTPSVTPAAPRGGSLPSPAGGAVDLPPHLVQMESTRPDEPLTEGLPMGPGAGPEILQMQEEPESEAEVVLRWLAEVARDQAASNMLAEMRAAKVTPPASPVAPVSAPMTPPPTADAEIDSLEVQDFDAPEEPLEETVVEGEEQSLPL